MPFSLATTAAAAKITSSSDDGLEGLPSVEEANVDTAVVVEAVDEMNEGRDYEKRDRWSNQ